MSSIAKQLLINSFNLPIELINIIKDYAFHKIKKIPENDKRYQILRTIPYKEYDPEDDTFYVYLRITYEKSYYLVYTNFQLQIQTLMCGDSDDDNVYFEDGAMFLHHFTFQMPIN